MSDRARLSLDLLYVALENLLVNLDDDEDGQEAAIGWLLTLAADMKGAITECWQALDVDIIDEIDLGG